MKINILLASVLVAAGLLVSSGCGPDCEETRHCSDSLIIAVMGTDGPVEAYRAEVTIDDEASTAECDHEEPREPGIIWCYSGRLRMHSTPEEIDVQVTADDGRTGGGSFSPSYVSFEKGMHGCSTTCEKAQVVVNVR